MKYDLIVYGGGTSGVASAYIASKYGIKTLLIEQTDTLGGAITQGLVVPSMKVDTENINTEFITDLKVFADKYSARHTYIDGNEFWFNPQLLKTALDDMLTSVNCTVLFSSYPIDVCFNNNLSLYENYISHKTLSIYIESKYIIDATSEGKIFKILNCEFQKKSENFQTPTLRFIVSGINIEKFADWLENFDTDRNVTTVERAENQIYLSTACTWDNRKWALKPLFEEAVRDNQKQMYAADLSFLFPDISRMAVLGISSVDADFSESHGRDDNGSRLSVTGGRHRLFCLPSKTRRLRKEDGDCSASSQRGFCCPRNPQSVSGRDDRLRPDDEPCLRRDRRILPERPRGEYGAQYVGRNLCGRLCTGDRLCLPCYSDRRRHVFLFREVAACLLPDDRRHDLYCSEWSGNRGVLCRGKRNQ